MNSGANTPVPTAPWALARLFWVVMLAGHAPALSSSFQKLTIAEFSGSRLLGFAVLCATMIFFAAKLLDLPALRVRLTRQSLLVIILAVAVLHGGFLDADFRLHLVIDDVLVWGGTTALVVGACRRKYHSHAIPSRAVAGLLAVFGTPRRTVWLDQFRSHCWVPASDLLHLRAPPA